MQMKIKYLFSAVLFFCLSACQYQKPQIVIIDSNVSAFVYQGERRIGETPFAGKIPRSEIGKVFLKRSGYETVKLPAKKVYSRALPSFSRLYTDVTALLHHLKFVPVRILTAWKKLHLQVRRFTGMSIISGRIWNTVWVVLPASIKHSSHAKLTLIS